MFPITPFFVSLGASCSPVIRLIENLQNSVHDNSREFEDGFLFGVKYFYNLVYIIDVVFVHVRDAEDHDLI